MNIIEEELKDILRKLKECHANAERRRTHPEAIDKRSYDFYEGQTRGYRQAIRVLEMYSDVKTILSGLKSCESTAKLCYQNSHSDVYLGNVNALQNSQEYLKRIQHLFPENQAQS